MAMPKRLSETGNKWVRGLASAIVFVLLVESLGFNEFFIHFHLLPWFRYSDALILILLSFCLASRINACNPKAQPNLNEKGNYQLLYDDTDEVDFIQAPFSVLDQRMKSSGALAKAASRGVDVHTRSAFVQGLMLMPPESIPQHLAATKPYVEELEALCGEHGVTRRALALAYVKAQPEISHLVFGVDNIVQLKEIISDFDRTVPADAVTDVAARFASVPAEIFMPNKWRKDK